MACYLTFDVANLGTLNLVWSKTEVEHALAIITPTTTVPKFKFTLRQGRSEIVRKIRDDKKKLYDGWCQYIKVARDCKGSLELLPGAPVEARVRVTFNKFGEVVPFNKGDVVNVADFSGVMVTNKDNDPLFMVKTMNNNQFLDLGMREGASLLLI